MTEELFINKGLGKGQTYEALLPQLEALINGETDLTANLANITAALKVTFNWWWVGFYWVKENQLVLAPFQGPIACTRIGFGKGVCGTVWKNAVETMQPSSLLVSNVNAFPGHIACSSSSVAEIVVPVFDNHGQVVGVLDVDSERYDTLDETDVFYLEQLSKLITKKV
jgi:L-methionine (R)-S-oxide reductase